MSLGQRLAAPVPKFFRVMRTIGLVLTAAAGAILSAPVSLPALVTTIAGYATVAGGVLAAVSQTTVDESSQKGNNGQ